MNSITILSTIHTQMPGIKGIALFLLVSCSVLLAISFCYLVCKGDHVTIFLVTFAICLIICIASSLAVTCIDDEQYVYATIEPDTSINEVLENYEVIEIDGDLYKLKIIEEKERKNDD